MSPLGSPPFLLLGLTPAPALMSESNAVDMLIYTRRRRRRLEEPAVFCSPYIKKPDTPLSISDLSIFPSFHLFQFFC